MKVVVYVLLYVFAFNSPFSMTRVYKNSGIMHVRSGYIFNSCHSWYNMSERNVHICAGSFWDTVSGFRVPKHITAIIEPSDVNKYGFEAGTKIYGTSINKDTSHLETIKVPYRFNEEKGKDQFMVIMDESICKEFKDLGKARNFSREMVIKDLEYINKIKFKDYDNE